MGDPLELEATIPLKPRVPQQWGSVPLALLDNYAIGVPHPQNYFEYNPLTLTRPSDPAAWPSAEDPEGLFYYVDNADGSETDTGNTYGYPDKPRLTLPVGTFPAGTVIIVGGGTNYTIGGPGRFEYTFNGTVDNPCWLVGEGAGNREMLKQVRFKDSVHAICEGLYFGTNLQNVEIGSFGSNPCSYITIRNNTFIGPGTASGNSNTVSFSGNATTRTENILVYNNVINSWGDDESVSENDYHGTLPGEYVTRAWVIENAINNNGGDSVQIGQASYTGLQRPSHIYVAKNVFHSDRENAVDIKGAIDVIISENEMYSYLPRSSSAGEVVIVHDDNEYVWIINNKIYDGDFCVKVTSGSNVFILGNEVRDTNGTVNFSTPYFDPNNAISITSAGPFTVAHNTVHNSILAYQATTGATMAGSQVSGNIFGERQDVAQGWDFMGESSGNAPSLVADYNVYDSIRGRISSTDYTSLPGWVAGTVYDDNAVEGDPLFTNEAADDFTLQAGSPAIGVVASEPAAYALFESRYSYDIRFDINGNPKPVTGADAGAYQRVA